MNLLRFACGSGTAHHVSVIHRSGWARSHSELCKQRRKWRTHPYPREVRRPRYVDVMHPLPSRLLDAPNFMQDGSPTGTSQRLNSSKGVKHP